MHRIIPVIAMLLVQSALGQNSQPIPVCSPWLKTLEEYYSGGQPQKLKPEFQNMRRILQSVDSLVKANPNFNTMQQGRFRSTIVVSNDQIIDAGERSIQAAHLNIKVYMERGWDNKCGLIPQADRIASDKAGFSIGFNRSGNGYTSLDFAPSKDDQLNAFREPVSTKKVGGKPFVVEVNTSCIPMSILH